MELAVFNSLDRERYRNPPTPLGYENLNPPEIIRREDPDEIRINFDEWIALGIFDDEDVTIYDHFVINSDSEDDDIIEVPFEPIVKNIESICISDDDEEIIPIPLDSIKKEKKETKTEKKTKDVEKKPQKIDSSRVKEVKSTEQRTEKKTLAKDDQEKRKEKKPEQRISKQLLDKEIDKEFIEKRKDKYKEKSPERTEKHRERKTKREEESRHKKLKPKSETSDSDKNSRSKIRLSTRDDDSDLEEGERPRRKVKKYRSPSPPDDYYEEDCKIFKTDYDEDYYPASGIKNEFPSVHGVYHCDVCNLTLNSEVTFESHMLGKRHKKNVDSRNVAQTVAKSFVPTKLINACPNPPPGFKRVESSSPAKIQHFVDETIKYCPALHKVIEIQGLTETNYYCILCDAPCSMHSILPHLNGFKHQLNCLKHYDSKLFDRISYKQKYQIENLVRQKLTEFEHKYGRNRMKVEKDVPADDIYDHANIPSTSSNQDHSFQVPLTSLRPSMPSRPLTPSRSSSSSRDQPSTSKLGSDFLELYQSSSLPDPSKAGFYCSICLSHSNSQAMWESHIRGKRHIANLKKAPGTAPSKSRNVPAPPGTIARLYLQLEDVYEPIVGLDQLREIQRLDIDSVSYTCFLCGGIAVSEGEIVDHIILTKHREKYLEKIKFPELETLRNCQMSEHALSAVIAEMCERVEHERGRGEPEVYYAKNSLVKM